MGTFVVDIDPAELLDMILGIANGNGALIEPQKLADQLLGTGRVALPDGTMPTLEDALADLKVQVGNNKRGVKTIAELATLSPMPPDGYLIDVTADPADVGGNINGTYQRDATAPAAGPVPAGWFRTANGLSVVKAVADLALAKVNPLADAIIPDSTLVVSGVNLIQRFTTPTPAGRRVSAGITDDFFLALFKGLKVLGTGGFTIDKSNDPDVILRVKGANNGRVMLQLHTDPAKTFGPWSKSSSSLSTNPLGADIIHIIVYGQSPGEGAESLPVMSTAPTGHAAYKFVRGVRTFKLDAYALNPTARPVSDFALTPLFEAQDGSVGETIATASAATLKEFVCGPNSPVARTAAPQILVTFAGRGGRFLDELSKVPVQPDGQGAYYDTTIDDVRRAKQYAVTQGKSYAVAGIVWMQGEANNALQMVRGGPTLDYADFLAQYQASLLTLADNLDADIRAITLQPGRIPFLTYQTGALSGGAASGQAQLNAAAAQPNKIQMLGPTYFVPSAKNGSYVSGGSTVHGNEVHLSADGERWFGSNVGKLLYRFLVQRQANLALRPIMARKLDVRTIELVLSVPRSPVRIDTNLLPAQGGAAMGFAIFYGTGTSTTAGPAITSVTVVDVDRLQIKLAADLSAGTVTLAYGQSRLVGNLSAAVVDWRDGATLPNGNPSKELVFSGSITSQVAKLLEEGCFFVNNVTLGVEKAWVARSVSESGGQTIFKGEASDVSGSGFAAGNTVSVSRPTAYGYGNICDADTAEGALSFADHSYGTRTGRYPLANWLTVFKDLVVI
ncbi:hypothetical protein [Inquilinus sp.]|jgi:hypothetical protein|uniref:hypothetical protein n=1 Tax=Inquilinus sp. TaxID=1932117 RepID=UPI003784A4FE